MSLQRLFLKMKNSFKKWFGLTQFSFFNGKAMSRESSFRNSSHGLVPINSQPPDSQLDNPLTIEDGSDNSLRRQLVQVLLRDVLRRHGISMNVIECQMLVVSSRTRGPGMFVRLVVRQWDERILRYAFAFQSALMTEILRFDSKAEGWLHGISWQLDLVSCPHSQMPEKSFWAKPPVSLAQTDLPFFAKSTETAAQPKVSHSDSQAIEENALAMPKFPPSLSKSQPNAITIPFPDKSPEKRDENAEALMDLQKLFFIRDQEMSRSSEVSLRHYEKTQPSPL